MAERIITPDWLILRQAMYGSRVTPLWPHKDAHRKKSAMIVLSGHFKTLIFYQIFDVPSYKLYGDHCRSLYINTFPFDRVLSPIDRYFDRFGVGSTCYRNTVVCPSSLIFHHNYNYIPGIKETGIVCFRFHRRTSWLGNSNVCAAIVPFFSITFVSVCQLSQLCAMNVYTPNTALKCCSYLNH